MVYFLVIFALIGLVGYRQYDAVQTLKEEAPGGALARSISSLESLADKATAQALLAAGATAPEDIAYRSKLRTLQENWVATSTKVTKGLSDGAPHDVGKALARVNEASKALSVDLTKARNGAKASQQQAAQQALRDLQPYRLAVQDLADEFDKTGATLAGKMESHLMLTAGLFAGIALLVSFLIIRPMLASTRKSVEFEQIRYLNEKEKTYSEKNKEVSEKAMAELQAKQEEMKAQAEALEVALSRAEEVNRLKTAFLANMSHEIRTPMNHVIGMAELLSQTSLTTEQREWLRTIIGSGNQLVTIINDILDLSQIEAGKLALDPVRFNLRHLVTDAVRPFEGDANAKNVSIAVWLAAGAKEEVISDPVRIRQVLTNLISNAIKFTSEGRIDVSAETVIGKDKAELRLSVKDTGIGIDPKRLQAIFDSFTQADVSTKRVYGGTGLGLTIVRQIAELMGGVVEVKSTPKQGSEFIVTVPVQLPTDLSKPEEATTPVSSVTDLPNLSLTCLVVEDNPVNQKVLVKLLEKLGCKVDTVDDGEAAVNRTRANSYDIILMDIHMPGKDGIEATKEIRDRERTLRQPATPIVAVTADAMQEDRQRFIDAGMDDYVAKPVRQATLVPILSRFRKVSVV
jgi:signal transduction histidine kinase/ActR/RegA family two-component response regulator